jgi:hypothetical protein
MNQFFVFPEIYSSGNVRFDPTQKQIRLAGLRE